MQRRITLATCLAIWLLCSHAQAAAVALSLDDAVALTLQNNRVIKIDQTNREADELDLRAAQDKFSPRGTINGEQARHVTPGSKYRSSTLATSVGILTPMGTKLSATLSAGRNDTLEAIPVSAKTLSLAVIQPLLKGAGTEVNQASVRTAELTDQVRLLSAQRTVANQVTLAILAYREYQRLLAQLAISRDALERARRLVTVNDTLIAAGRLAPGDRLEAEAEVANQELVAEEALNQLDAARLSLLSLLALAPATELILTEPLTAAFTGIDLDGALHAATAYSPELRISALTGQVLRLNEATAQNARLWDVALMAGHTTGKADSPSPGSLRMMSNRTNDTFVGLQVSIPLGDLSAKQAHARARADFRTDQLRHADLAQELERRVRDAVRNVHNGRSQLNIAERAVELSRKKMEFEDEKLKLGRSSNFVVLNFAADLRMAEANRINAMIGYLNALTALDTLTGTVFKKWNIQLNQ